MRFYSCIGLLILGFCAVIVVPEVIRGQPGGFQPGGQPGGFGKGRSKGGGMFTDPKAAFESLSNGRGFFLITESKMSAQLTEFAKTKKITNGQITLPQYLEYMDQVKSKWGSGGTGGKSPFGGGGMTFGGKPGMTLGPPPGVTVLSAQQQQNPDVLNELSDKEFKKRDQNDDGVLNSEEMSSSLRDNLAKWDTNKDGMIDMKEYRPYFIAKLKGEGEFDKGGKGKKSNAPIIIIEEDNWDVRPKVLRADRLHPDLPSWFKELDLDGDGQVALYEWRTKKPIDEFRNWDINGDGFITQEEALKLKGALAGGAKKTGPGGATASADTTGERTGAGGDRTKGKGKKDRPQP